jgi:hypothetical protein
VTSPAKALASTRLPDSASSACRSGPCPHVGEHLREEVLEREGLRQRHPHSSHADADLSADLEEPQADRAALRPFELGAGQAQPETGSGRSPWSEDSQCIPWIVHTSRATPRLRVRGRICGCDLLRLTMSIATVTQVPSNPWVSLVREGDPAIIHSVEVLGSSPG